MPTVYHHNFGGRMTFTMRVPDLISHPDQFFTGWRPILQRVLTRELTRVKEECKALIPRGDSADHWIQTVTAGRRMHGMTSAGYDRWAAHQQSLNYSRQRSMAETHIRDALYFSFVQDNPFNQRIYFGFHSNIFFKAYVHAYRGTSVLPGKSAMRQRVGYQRPSPGARGRLRERRLPGGGSAKLTFPVNYMNTGVWKIMRFTGPVFPGSHRFAAQRHGDWEINVPRWLAERLPQVRDNIADAWTDYLRAGDRLNRMPA